jgi:OOP family OmpA-OmpF porin
LRLSQARADAVRTYLATKGVTVDRMIAKGYGPTQPVAPNTTADGRALNRRVELRKLN